MKLDLIDSIHIFLWFFSESILLIFSIISFFIYRETKKKEFINYVFYSFFLFTFLLYSYPFINFEKRVIFADDHYALVVFTQVMSAYFNFRFTTYFLDIKKLKPKLYKFIFGFNNTFILGFAILFIIFWIVHQLFFIENSKYIISFLYYIIYQTGILIAGIYIVIAVIKIPSAVKYYFIIGQGIYLVLAITSGYMGTIKPPPVRHTIDVFYVGLIVETVMLSLGLGKKIKLLFKENIDKSVQIHRLISNQNKTLEDRLSQSEKKIEQYYIERRENEKQQLIKDFEFKILDSQMTALRSQMNPHFIFNSLNSIKNYIIENETKEAIFYLNKFAKLIRTILQSSNEKITTLAQEFEFIDLYIKIENIRFSMPIKYYLDLSPDLEKFEIPPLLLQPFIENAIWHGFIDMEDSKPSIWIKAYKSENQIIIEIKDNGIGIDNQPIEHQKKKHRKSIGIELCKKRMELYDQQNNCISSISIQNNPNPKEKGTLVKISIQKL